MEEMASAKVAKASWRKNKGGGGAELGWKWSFRIGDSGQRVPFYNRCGVVVVI
jgi:hypothetical protein